MRVEVKIYQKWDDVFHLNVQEFITLRDDISWLDKMVTGLVVMTEHGLIEGYEVHVREQPISKG